MAGAEWPPPSGRGRMVVVDPGDAEVLAAVAERVAAIHARTTLFSIEEVQRRLTIGRSSVYEALATGGLESVRIGGRRLVSLAALDAFVSARVETTSDGDGANI